MRRGQWLAGVGVIVGFVAAYAGGRATGSLVYGIRATDPVVLNGNAVVALIALTATAIPAHRAAHTAPCSSCVASEPHVHTPAESPGSANAATDQRSLEFGNALRERSLEFKKLRRGRDEAIGR